MARAKRNRRAKNKIDPSNDGALIKAEPETVPAIVVQRTDVVRVRRASMFSAELEEVIEIIARDRVYRSMLAGLGRRLLAAPTPNGQDPLP
jgi:hypothetical protein